MVVRIVNNKVSHARGREQPGRTRGGMDGGWGSITVIMCTSHEHTTQHILLLSFSGTVVGVNLCMGRRSEGGSTGEKLMTLRGRGDNHN